MKRDELIKAIAKRKALDSGPQMGKEAEIAAELDKESDSELQRVWDEEVSPRARLNQISKATQKRVGIKGEARNPR